MLAMTRYSRPLSQAGVTLLELAVVLTIATVLAVMVMPSIMDRWQRATVELLAQRLASTISLAQSTAQHRHVQTLIGPRENSDWASGWALTELTLPTPGTPTASGGKVLIYVSLPTAPAVQLSSNRRAVSYAAVGYSRLTEVNGATLTITSGRHTRCVAINTVGRPVIFEPAANSSCTAASSADNADP